ncbi:NAD(P)H-dependent oxidoreductase [Kineosporia sp. J2-2]|uniref:FMN dependent NADH:quinone oxidoreductase n=1 Tax=Kineosporia corallincola TaxID=2835133 RepID=A0ABS5TKM2_9ACTN|nr:NAD(P)H-dependent oxidoreductase [Kineosporia corallincola]MBT0770726.1 NAD(P)H-dependent oxidoreductase [Kineosporia corallincola]
MSNLLHLDASLRRDGSRSRMLSARFAQKWLAARPDGTVTYRDLAADPVPHLDEASYTTLFAEPAERTAEQAERWAFGDVFVQELLAADSVVIGLPLYNFGPPSSFMSWLDRIVTPDRTLGRLGDKQFVFALASGGGYGPGTPRHGWDHREPWLRHVFDALGVTDPVFVTAELTLARESPMMIPLDLGEASDQSLADALSTIDRLAA